MSTHETVIRLEMNRCGDLTVTAPGIDNKAAIDAVWDALQRHRYQDDIQEKIAGATGIA